MSCDSKERKALKKYVASIGTILKPETSKKKKVTIWVNSEADQVWSKVVLRGVEWGSSWADINEALTKKYWNSNIDMIEMPDIVVEALVNLRRAAWFAFWHGHNECIVISDEKPSFDPWRFVY